MAKPAYRSPKYSRLTLDTSIKKGEALLSFASQLPVKEEEIACLLGYQGLTGRSIAVTSALKKYKILESDGGGLNLTDSVIKFFDSATTDTERYRIVKRAAYAPALFSDIFKHFEGQLPNDSEFENYLAEHNFNPASFGKIIKIFVKNYNLVETYKNTAIKDQSSKESDLNNSTTPISSRESNSISAPVTPKKSNEVSDLQTIEEAAPRPQQKVTFTLSEKAEARILLCGDVRAADIENLIRHLEIFKANFPAE